MGIKDRVSQQNYQFREIEEDISGMGYAKFVQPGYGVMDRYSAKYMKFRSQILGPDAPVPAGSTLVESGGKRIAMTPDTDRSDNVMYNFALIAATLHDEDGKVFANEVEACDFLQGKVAPETIAKLVELAGNLVSPPSTEEAEKNSETITSSS